MPRRDRLRLALAGFEHYGTTTEMVGALRRWGLPALESAANALTPEHRDQVIEEADSLADRGFDACALGATEYPNSLTTLRRPPPILFVWGNAALFKQPAVGMCGSRHASAKGLEAAATCGEEVATHGLTVVSGYARGVDTETHLAALRTNGRTVIVLAEGISHFRQKRTFAEVGLDPDRVLVVSQFRPRQRWSVGAAMTRNGVIVGLGKALVVVEAGETGGTLNAALQALEIGRPVLALEFSAGTPAGNELLFNKGAFRIRSRQQLGRVLQAIEETPGHDVSTSQLSLL